MPSFVALSLVAATAFALSSLGNKFASRHTISNNWALLFYYYVAALPFVLAVPLVLPVVLPAADAWPFIVLYALCFFAGNVFFTIAIYGLDASTFAPFFQLQAAFIALLAFLFLGERFAPVQYLTIGLMLAGVVLVSLDERFAPRSFLRLATLLIVLQQFFHALSNLAAGFALRHADPVSFFFWADLLSSGFVVLLLPLAGRHLRVRFAQVRPLMFSGFCSTIGAVALFTAFESNLTLSSALALLTSPIVLALSWLAALVKPDLLERHSGRVYLVRALGTALVLFAALRLSM